MAQMVSNAIENLINAYLLLEKENKRTEKHIELCESALIDTSKEFDSLKEQVKKLKDLCEIRNGCDGDLSYISFPNIWNDEEMYDFWSKDVKKAETVEIEKPEEQPTETKEETENA